MVKQAFLIGMTVIVPECFGEPIYRFDFKTDPATAGWVYTPSEAEIGNKLVYIPSEDYYANKGGKLAGPKVACTDNPFQFYIMTFQSATEIKCHYAAFFQDKDGKDLVADNYASIYPSENLTNNVVCFRGREDAKTFTINFISKKPVTIRDLEVIPVDASTVCKWADALYAMLPPLEYNAPSERWKFIPKTIAALRSGKPLRVVMLGDSIVNDTNNSNWDALVMRMYPESNIHVIPSVHGATACWYYREDEHFKNYVIDHSPDLLMIGGISHRNDIEAIREVIEKARAHLDCEILLMSGPVGPDWRAHDADNPGNPIPETSYDGNYKFEKKLEALAKDMKVEFLDMRTTWNDYLAGSEQPYEYFYRDRVHANDRGKQILARIIEQYFAP